MEKRIIEVNGVKLEVDLSTARVVEEYKVGDPVKVLVKKYDGYASHAGVIVGFDAFEKLPSINIAYLDSGYSTADMKFISFNAQSKEVEICAMNNTEVPFVRDNVLELMDRDITAAEQKVADLKTKKAYFQKQFGVYFKNLVEA
jgi:hypothetical protein